MATFKSHYTTSELLKVMKRCSLDHCYWSYQNGEYTFYFIDNRRVPILKSNGLIHISCHKANYYRLRNKINLLPFRLDLRRKFHNHYSFDLVPDSYFLYDCASTKIKQLNEGYRGQLIVRVVVI